MEELDGSVIFWLISLGLLVGGITKALFGRRARGIYINLIGGVSGALITGIVGSVLQINGNLAFAVMGAVAFLFLLNIFSLVDEAYPSEDKKVQKK